MCWVPVTVRSWDPRHNSKASALKDFSVWSPQIITTQYDRCHNVDRFREPRGRGATSCLGNPRIQKRWHVCQSLRGSSVQLVFWGTRQDSKTRQEELARCQGRGRILRAPFPHSPPPPAFLSNANGTVPTAQGPPSGVNQPLTQHLLSTHELRAAFSQTNPEALTDACEELGVAKSHRDSAALPSSGKRSGVPVLHSAPGITPDGQV